MEGFLIAARAVHYSSTISLAGVFAFLCFVADPKPWPKLGRRLMFLAATSLVLGLLSGAAWLLFVSTQMSGQPIAVALRQGVLATVLHRTRFGQIWTLRVLFAVLMAALLVLPHGSRRGLWRWAGLAISACILGSLAWAGHGGATPGRPGDLHLAADILHLLAAGAWVGSLVPLALLLSELRRDRIDDAGSTHRARQAVVRFSLLAAISVVILFAAGLINTWFLAGSVPALIGTEYGRLLLAKVALFLTMVTIAAVNLLRMTPRLATGPGTRHPLVAAALSHLRRNALIEASFGLCVLCIVAKLGILPPALHTEPGWPLPFRLEPAALAGPSRTALALLTASAIALVGAVIATAAARRYHTMIAACAGVVLCLAIGWLVARPAIEPAYPTSFYAPAEPYAAPSVEQGARLYVENCALCHGAGGKGDGPAAAALAVQPADLTAPHLFAHSEGDLFWWISHGKANGAMPGFAGTLSPADRWDLINFIRARAAGILSRALGPTISAEAGPAVPDFAFETEGHQLTLSRLLETGPVLIALFRKPPSAARLAQLAASRQRLALSGLRVVAVDLDQQRAAPPEAQPALPLVTVAPDAAATLRLFRVSADGDETDLMLDQAGNVRARWTASNGLPDIDTLRSAAVRMAQLPASPPSHSHAGHGG
ncbi:MAG: copper homeostasis membrane protein CopD [Stellaceae bacterium]